MEERKENTFSILCTKESADPMAETHKMIALDMSFKDNLQDMFPAFTKYRGANVLKNMGTDSLNFRTVDSIASISCFDTCTTHSVTIAILHLTRLLMPTTNLNKQIKGITTNEKCLLPGLHDGLQQNLLG